MVEGATTQETQETQETQDKDCVTFLKKSECKDKVGTSLCKSCVFGDQSAERKNGCNKEIVKTWCASSGITPMNDICLMSEPNPCSGDLTCREDSVNSASGLCCGESLQPIQDRNAPGGTRNICTQ